MDDAGKKMWERAKQVIPGGSSLLSKRAEMHLPNLWPSYYQSAKGCQIVGIDHKIYIDVSFMGVGTNVLGYSFDPVDDAVSLAIKQGNLSTLNCYEEVLLAEKLVEIDNFSEMVRFTRSGGEANAVAIRIARAATGRDAIAICGYHGWHDWYLSANLKRDQLKSHHLSGLEPAGVPSALAGITHAFQYNDFAGLENIVSENSLAAIKMEVMRNYEPEDDFLQKVRELATKHNIVLIFDECSSGFRETCGGLYKKFNVEPDIIVYGKTLANGYALNAVCGRRSVMDAAQKTFISSTFWTERIGPVAALEALSQMEKINSFETVPKVGATIKQNWKRISENNNVEMVITGTDSIPVFSFQGEFKLEYKTFMTQEMLKKGYLASTAFYSSTAHTTSYVERYLSDLNDVIHRISVTDPDRLKSEIEGPLCHQSFERLN